MGSAELARTPERDRLEALPAEIGAELQAAEADCRSALGHAIAAGEKLIEAKQLVGHGVWQDWLRENFDAADRQARRYMQLAAERTRVSDLGSIRKAIALLNEPKPRRDPDRRRAPVPTPTRRRRSRSRRRHLSRSPSPLGSSRRAARHAGRGRAPPAGDCSTATREARGRAATSAAAAPSGSGRDAQGCAGAA